MRGRYRVMTGVVDRHRIDGRGIDRLQRGGDRRSRTQRRSQWRGVGMRQRTMGLGASGAGPMSRPLGLGRGFRQHEGDPDASGPGTRVGDQGGESLNLAGQDGGGVDADNRMPDLGPVGIQQGQPHRW